MTLLRNLAGYISELLKRPLRAPYAMLRFRHARISYGVVVGPNCHLGQRVRIHENAILANTDIGDYSYVGGGSRLQNCRIGKYCSLGPEVQVGLGIHPTDRISTYPGFYSARSAAALRLGEDSRVREFEQVRIGHDVWIGNRATIMDGVEIGNGCVVAAGSIVTADVEPYSIVGGVPAKLIRKRFDPGQIALLQELKWWDRSPEFLAENADLFNSPARFFAAFGGDAGGNAS